MSQAWPLILAFLLAIMMVPVAIKWWQARFGLAGLLPANQSKVLSAVAVGPVQRVVTVEVGREGERVLLVLGVTPQHVSCLYTQPITEVVLIPAATLNAKPQGSV